MSNPAPVIIIAGPTASGKSALAIDLAETFGGCVINADSMQVYAELRVLTARPGADAEARAPHRLYGVLPASEACSVGRWLKLAHAAIAETRAEGLLPIIVGGTGMYLKALTEGLAPVPSIPPAFSAEARALFKEIGGEVFRQRLAELDPDAAGRLPAGDSQRLIRAYEVVQATDRTLADWQADGANQPPISGGFVTIALIPPREDLYQTAEARFDEMMAAEAVEEVRALGTLDLDPALPAAKALGVPELTAHLNGELDLDGAVARAKQATRNLAKRQLTWFRNQMQADLTIEASYDGQVSSQISDFLRTALSAV
jgi:tRNA dimethylallyltransferase